MTREDEEGESMELIRMATRSGQMASNGKLTSWSWTSKD
jgi:hypothetical protein